MCKFKTKNEKNISEQIFDFLIKRTCEEVWGKKKIRQSYATVNNNIPR